MTLLKTADNRDIPQCDGCGRSEGGTGVDLGIREFAVHDPNVGGPVKHHYCLMCQGNRGANLETMSVPWPANTVITSTPVAADAAPEEALSAELPAPVEKAAAAAENIEKGSTYD